MKKLVEEIFLSTIGTAIGWYGEEPAGPVRIDASVNSEPARIIYRFFKTVLNTDTNGNGPKAPNLENLRTLYEEAKKRFICFYLKPSRYETLIRKEGQLRSSGDPETRARIVSEIWAPELLLTDEEIVKRWRLKEIMPAPEPPRPEEIVFQLNGLYTTPDPELQADAKAPSPTDYGRRIADYDHPVPLYAEGEEHELAGCLKELDLDIGFEKSKGTLAAGHRLSVIVSISVTHEGLEEPVTIWVEETVRRLGLKNLAVFLLSELTVEAISNELLEKRFDVFTVRGEYAAHFNALKYVQLLFERGLGCRAGFKLDTDEGIRSRELYEATGKSWLSTLCHPFWGGSGVDCEGREATLGFGVGEYVNNTDILRLGYEDALREPDVKVPGSYGTENIFFNKQFAHGRATALYNRFNRIEDCVSHPVLKGGGYGITNESLAGSLPFCLSVVGRAEDQQFYFHGLSMGLRGLFNPNLRIAHYKERVRSREQGTEARRFAGDMYRLLLFSKIADHLGVKKDIDPMPGVFAGGLALPQALFSALYRAYVFCTENRTGDAHFLLNECLPALGELDRRIASGMIEKLFKSEGNGWREIALRMGAANQEKCKRFIQSRLIF